MAANNYFGDLNRLDLRAIKPEIIYDEGVNFLKEAEMGVEQESIDGLR